MMDLLETKIDTQSKEYKRNYGSMEVMWPIFIAMEALRFHLG